MRAKNNRGRTASTQTALRWLILPVIVVFFSGCQLISPAETATETQTPETVAAETEQPTPDATIEPTAAPTDEPTPTEAETPTAAPLITVTDLGEILGEIAGLQNGTAGISLKRTAAAAKALDWAEHSSLSEQEIAAEIADYTAGLSDPEDVATFYINFNIISDIPQKIIDRHAGTLNTLSESGYTPAYTAYTQAKWDLFLEAYRDCLPNLYTSYAHMVAFDPETGWAMFDYWDMLKGDAAVDWLVEHEGYSETDAQTEVDDWGDSEYIEKNVNPRLRVVDMSDVSIKMMYHADGAEVLDAIPVSLTYSQFLSLYAANPNGVLNTYFYQVTVSGGEVTKVEQVYWP